jgi:hypothetical protein
VRGPQGSSSNPELATFHAVGNVEQAAAAAAATSLLPLAMSTSLAWEDVRGVASGSSGVPADGAGADHGLEAATTVASAQEMVADIEREITARLSASVKLKVGLLAWFCKNLRQRCHAEVLARCDHSP